MKKLIVLTVLVITIPIIVLSQSCLPDGITFTTQEQIDNFQINHPGCTEIEGDVIIRDDDIVNLQGLFSLTEVGGDFTIEKCINLTSLVGLDNIQVVGGSLIIEENELITNLSGLNNLSEVGGSFNILSCGNLENLQGVENLGTIGGSLTIGYSSMFYPNHNLISLTGLEGLLSIGGDLDVLGNYKLENLSGLDNLISINGELKISWNNSLVDISGLGQLQSNSITELTIYHNTSLSICNAQVICEFIDNPSGPVNIYSNATGCNNPAEIADACGISLECLPFGNYYFLTQNDVDTFSIIYPGCTQIEGNIVLIGNDEIQNLNGLNSITSISGNLAIGGFYSGNYNLTDISGLSNLTQIGGSLVL